MKLFVYKVFHCNNFHVFDKVIVDICCLYDSFLDDE